MLVVETFGRIRREHRIKGKSIREIARDLKVSRNTVRKVLRSGATSFEYMRVVQPRPKLGAWHGDLDRMLSDNEAGPARERLTLIRVFEELRGLGYQGSYDAVRRYAKKWRVERRSVRAAELCAGRGVSIRLVARGRADQRHDSHGQGGACPAVPQPDAVRAGLSARDPGDGVRRAQPRLRLLQRDLHARHLRQHEDGRR